MKNKINLLTIFTIATVLSFTGCGGTTLTSTDICTEKSTIKKNVFNRWWLYTPAFKTGKSTIEPPMYQITAIKITANGISINAAIVAFVKNPLMLSKSFKLLANEPTEDGWFAIFRSRTFSKIIDDIITSLFLAANSSRYVLVNFKNVSKIYIIATPIANTQSVSVALFGTTLSYTFIVKRGLAKTNKFISNEAYKTSL